MCYHHRLFVYAPQRASGARIRKHVITIALALSGCSFEWNQLDPRLGADELGPGGSAGAAGAGQSSGGATGVAGAAAAAGTTAAGGAPSSGGSGGSGGDAAGGAPASGGSGGSGGDEVAAGEGGVPTSGAGGQRVAGAAGASGDGNAGTAGHAGQVSGGMAGVVGGVGGVGAAGSGGAAAAAGTTGAGGSAGVAGAGGAQPVRVCEMVNEDESLTLTCPASATVLAVDFASYGTPTGTCGSFATSDCHAATSQGVLETACLGLNTCTVAADNRTFGDPCRDTPKRLYVEVTCGSSGN